MIDAVIKSIAKWAETGDTATPESAGIDRAVGWGAAYSQARTAGGRSPERNVFNRLFYELTAMAVALRDHGGALEWDSQVNYEHPAAVFGSDGNLYLSLSSSSNIDPTATGGSAKWARVNPPNASTTLRGIVELATSSETIAGTDTVRAVTPAGLAAAVPGGSLLDVRVFTTSQSAYLPHEKARRFFAIATAGGQAGGAHKAGDAGGTAFGFWTEATRPTIMIAIGAGGGVLPDLSRLIVQGGDTLISTTGVGRLNAYGGADSRNINTTSSNTTYGTANKLHVRGGQGIFTSHGETGGASFWGGMGSYGAGGGDKIEGDASIVFGGQPGVAMIWSFT